MPDSRPRWDGVRPASGESTTIRGALSVHTWADLSGSSGYYVKSKGWEQFSVKLFHVRQPAAPPIPYIHIVMIIALRALLIASTLAGMLAGAGARADVYTYTDADGVVHYTNVPSHNGFQLIFALLKAEAADNRAKASPQTGRAAEFAPHVEAAAEEFGVDKALVHAVITAESGYSPRAGSRVGAQGLMQLMPGTAKRYEVADAFDPAQNIRGGTRYLRDLLDLFGDNLELALAAYNAGENAVIRHGRKIPPYRETLAYVPKVLRLYEKLRVTL